MRPLLIVFGFLFSVNCFGQTTLNLEMEGETLGNKFLRVVHGDKYFDIWGEEKYKFSHENAQQGPKKLSLYYFSNGGKILQSETFWIEDREYSLIGKVSEAASWAVFPDHPWNQIEKEIESADLEMRKKLIFKHLDKELGQEKLIAYKKEFAVEELKDALILIPSDSWYHGEIVTYLTLNESTRAKIGEPAPDFSLESKSGEMFQLSDQKGKYTLLEFSYTGCTYCFLAIPELRKLHDEMGDQIQIVSVWKDPKKTIWLNSQADKKSQIVWTDLWDPNGLSSSLFEIKVWPSYVLIDPDGRVKSIWTGYKKGDNLSRKIIRAMETGRP